MPTNFAFLKNEWPDIYATAVKAENLANTDAGTTCFHARRALDLAVDWIYKYDEDLARPLDDNLSTKIFATDFRDNTPPHVFGKIDYIRRIGNKAVHTQKVISTVDALQTVRELFHVLYWMARSYTQGEVSQFDGLQFDEAEVPA
jgi:type I restriction enzyme R subunit